MNASPGALAEGARRHSMPAIAITAPSSGAAFNRSRRRRTPCAALRPVRHFSEEQPAADLFLDRESAIRLFAVISRGVSARNMRKRLPPSPRWGNAARNPVCSRESAERPVFLRRLIAVATARSGVIGTLAKRATGSSPLPRSSPGVRAAEAVAPGRKALIRPLFRFALSRPRRRAIPSKFAEPKRLGFHCPRDLLSKR